MALSSTDFATLLKEKQEFRKNPPDSDPLQILHYKCSSLAHATPCHQVSLKSLEIILLPFLNSAYLLNTAFKYIISSLLGDSTIYNSYK